MAQNKPEQLSFSSDEVKCLRDYINFVNSEASFNLKPQRMQEFINLTKAVIIHMKKCDAHIFEITEHIKAEK